MSNLELIKKAMSDKLAADICVIDFINLNPFYDYFLIGTALNDRMASAIIDNIANVATENNLAIRSIEKSTESGWMIIDLYDIVVHIFNQNTRLEYNLERLWGDHLV